MSQPDIDCPYKLQPPSPPSGEDCCHVLPAVCHTRWGCRSRNPLQMCKIPLSNKPLMSLSLSSGSFFGFRLDNYKACRPAGRSPTTFHSSFSWKLLCEYHNHFHLVRKLTYNGVSNSPKVTQQRGKSSNSYLSGSKACGFELPCTVFPLCCCWWWR